MRPRVVSATEFKAKCLALLSQMEEEGGAITITKRGRPVAVLGPVRRKGWKSPKGSWAGKVRIQGDLANMDTSGLWDVTRK
jgi:prevent-host-death family protein